MGALSAGSSVGPPAGARPLAFAGWLGRSCLQAAISRGNRACGCASPRGGGGRTIVPGACSWFLCLWVAPLVAAAASGPGASGARRLGRCAQGRKRRARFRGSSASRCGSRALRRRGPLRATVGVTERPGSARASLDLGGGRAPRLGRTWPGSDPCAARARRGAGGAVPPGIAATTSCWRSRGHPEGAVPLVRAAPSGASVVLGRDAHSRPSPLCLATAEPTNAAAGRSAAAGREGGPRPGAPRARASGQVRLKASCQGVSTLQAARFVACSGPGAVQPAPPVRPSRSHFGSACNLPRGA